jgi:uncharacterized phage protein gp47/JayE
MANISNPWLSPLQRGYNQIKEKLLEGVRSITDSEGNSLITDFSEGNIFVILSSLFAGIAETIHYYLDVNARETFLSTANKYESLVKHGTLVDYHPRAAIAATVDVILTRPLNSSSIDSQISIPKNTVFNDNAGNKWMVAKNTYWAANTTSVSVPLIQHEQKVISGLSGVPIPSSNGSITIRVPNFSGNSLYEDGTMVLRIGSNMWTLVETFAHSKPTDKHFMVESNENGEISIVFGDGRFGMIPPANSTITLASCYITKGINGNILSDSITEVPSSISSVASDATCNNPYDAAGGSDVETFQQLKEHIPLSVKTLGVAITKQDFVDLAKTVGGVSKAVADYECGKKLTIYISPDNGNTVASETLCENVYNYISQRSPMSTWLNVKSAGIVNIMLTMDITGKPSCSANEIRSQVVNALMDKYSAYTSEIGGQVRLSDIYALIDNLPTVDYLHITKFYMKPWPITLYGNCQLLISSYNLISATGSTIYILSFISSTEYSIRSKVNGFQDSGVVGTSKTFNDTINGNTFSLAIGANSYALGYMYQVTISEPNHDYEEPGFNIPVFTNANNHLNLTIHETL